MKGEKEGMGMKRQRGGLKVGKRRSVGGLRRGGLKEREKKLGVERERGERKKRKRKKRGADSREGMELNDRAETGKSPNTK